MSKTRQFSTCVALLLMLGMVTSEAAGQNRKKLQIFILAGQSNMVGHASYITIPALLTAEDPGVRQLAKLIFKGALAPGAARDLVETRLKRDKLSDDLRAKKITDPDRITAAQAELKKLSTAIEDKSKRYWFTARAIEILPFVDCGGLGLPRQASRRRCRIGGGRFR